MLVANQSVAKRPFLLVSKQANAQAPSLVPHVRLWMRERLTGTDFLNDSIIRTQR